MKNLFLHSLLFLVLFFTACQKSATIHVGDNQPPIVNNIPAIKIESYVNRIFIDLLGREPLDSEMQAEVAALRAADLATEARETLILKLQTSTDFIEGDTSYQRAYYQQLYNLAKVRCIEGASDQDINEYIGGTQDPAVIMRLTAIKESRAELQNDEITIDELFARLIHNAIYDDINMNTTNFVNASFDNLLWRYPTNFEFQAGFNMVENSTTQPFLGQEGSNREDYVQIMTNSREFFEGLMIWTYQQLLARRPTTEETLFLLEEFYNNRDLSRIQRTVMVTDEYAGF